jgi:hypothetical protein
MGKEIMRKKIIGIVLFMLLTATLLPITALAGDPENPEFIDRIRDVKLFGLFSIPFQNEYKYADVVAAWLHEESANPDYLSVSLQIRDLEEKTESLEAIYDVDWLLNQDRFIANLHINPDGIGSFSVGRSLDLNDDIDEWIDCGGTVDIQNNVITWFVPKEFMRNPPRGSTITSILPAAILRFTDDSGLPLMDLFKDLPMNAKTSKEYVLQC